jgi:hypothetical protein
LNERRKPTASFGGAAFAFYRNLRGWAMNAPIVPLKFLQKIMAAGRFRPGQRVHICGMAAHDESQPRQAAPKIGLGRS